MISNKGYKENSFKERLSYKLPKITVADLADEFIQNSNKRQKKKQTKENKDIEK